MDRFTYLRKSTLGHKTYTRLLTFQLLQDSKLYWVQPANMIISLELQSTCTHIHFLACTHPERCTEENGVSPSQKISSTVLCSITNVHKHYSWAQRRNTKSKKTHVVQSRVHHISWPHMDVHYLCRTWHQLQLKVRSDVTHTSQFWCWRQSAMENSKVRAST